jgi:hypothetical protein
LITSYGSKRIRRRKNQPRKLVEESRAEKQKQTVSQSTQLEHDQKQRIKRLQIPLLKKNRLNLLHLRRSEILVFFSMHHRILLHLKVHLLNPPMRNQCNNTLSPVPLPVSLNLPPDLLLSNQHITVCLLYTIIYFSTCADKETKST